MIFKNVLFILVVFLTFTFCDSSSNIVGSNEDVEINNVSFIVDTTYLMNSQLYAKGRVTNLGTKSTESPWYVEAQFYTDSTYKLKLGGDYTEIGVPLDPYQSTFWTLIFSTSTVDVNEYPNFRVSDFRAIYKN